MTVKKRHKLMSTPSKCKPAERDAELLGIQLSLDQIERRLGHLIVAQEAEIRLTDFGAIAVQRRTAIGRRNRLIDDSDESLVDEFVEEDRFNTVPLTIESGTV